MTGTNPEMDEIWAVFAQESQDNLAIIEDTLIRLEKIPDNPDDIAGLFRAMHTFKGTVRMMDFSTTEALAHRAEDLVALVRDENVPLDQEMIDVLLVAVDSMRESLEYILTHHSDLQAAHGDSITQKLDEMVQRKRGGVQIPDAGQAETSMPVGDTEPPAVEAGAEPLADIAPAATQPPVENEKPEETPIEASQSGDDYPQALIFEPVNLADDPQFLQFFLEMAHEEMTKLHNALAEIAALAPGKVKTGLLNKTLAPVNALSIAAERMNFTSFNGLLEKIRQTLDPVVKPFNAARKEQSQLLGKELAEALTEIGKKANQNEPQPTQPVAAPLAKKAETTTPSPDLSGIFTRWYGFRLKSDLDRLQEVIEPLTRSEHEDSIDQNQRQKIMAEGLSSILSEIYQSCIYYHFEQAASLTLALEDLGIRIRQGEMPVGGSFTGLLQTYLSELRRLFNDPDGDQTTANLTFSAMENLARQMINLNSKSPVLQVTRCLVDSLDISDKFKETFTNENLMEINQALRSGQTFYILSANLDENETLGMAFHQWVRSGMISPITNITIDCNDHCIYQFLAASSQDLDSIRQSMLGLDPQQLFLQIEECRPLSSIDLQVMPESLDDYSVFESSESIHHIETSLPVEAISELNEIIGGLVADQSTIQRVINRLSEGDTKEIILRILHNNLDSFRLGKDTWEKLKRGLEQFWNAWETDFSSLAQTEVKQSAALVELQEKTRALGLQSANVILDPLPRLAQSLALRQGKQLTIDCLGGETELDQHSSSLLSNTLQSLLVYCVSESLETPDRRQKAGKAVTGHIKVMVTRTENHSIITIEDDGRGLDADKIKQRARDLGWKNIPTTSDDLIKAVFRPDFYPPTGTQINLAVLASGLQARHGSLSLNAMPGQGQRFTIRLPLEMVVLDGMVVRVGDVSYIVPVNAIQRIVQPSDQDLVTSSAGKVGALLNLEGKVYPVRRFNGSNGHQTAPADKPSVLQDEPEGDKQKTINEQTEPNVNEHNRLLVIIEKEPQAVALEVNELKGRQSVLVQPLSGHMVNARNAVGCALLGEGEVGMVLNLDAL